MNKKNILYWSCLLLITLIEPILKGCEGTTLEISSVAVTNVTTCLGNNNGSITISATGGIPPYLYSIDGGNIWQENQIFTELPVGYYFIEVQDSYGCIVSYNHNPAHIFQIPEPECLPANRLIDVNSFELGAPIQSVAWLCQETCPYNMIAVGGYKSICHNASLHVYQLDLCTDNLLELVIDNPLPTSCIYSVDWCCIEKIPYLAVAGAPDEDTGQTVWIYKYDVIHNRMELITSFEHGNTVYAVSWQCQTCAEPFEAYLAIGGKIAHDANIRILKFDAQPYVQTLTPISSTLFGATVYSLDWCIQNPRCPLLAAGGRSTTHCQDTHNVIIYAVSCAGSITPIERKNYKGKTVRILRWCCQMRQPCNSCPWLAVGGDPIEGGCKIGTTLELFVFDQYKHCLKEFAHHVQPGKVFALAWLPTCNCSRLIVGSGCLEDTCQTSNINVYSVEKKHLPCLHEITHTRFDDTITSIGACTIGDITYALAGAEHRNWNQKISDILCHPCKKIKELALFKGKFCGIERHPKPLCHHKKEQFMEPLKPINNEHLK